MQFSQLYENILAKYINIETNKYILWTLSQISQI